MIRESATADGRLRGQPRAAAIVAREWATGRPLHSDAFEALPNLCSADKYRAMMRECEYHPAVIGKRQNHATVYASSEHEAASPDEIELDVRVDATALKYSHCPRSHYAVNAATDDSDAHDYLSFSSILEWE